MSLLLQNHFSFFYTWEGLSRFSSALAHNNIGSAKKYQIFHTELFLKTPNNIWTIYAISFP